MRIGLDFDNTIVSYDNIFFKVALEKGIIDKKKHVNKLLIREYLISLDKELIWTELQGEVYGPRMHEANSFVGVLDFISKACELGHNIFIISHKTKNPIKGPMYDLHNATKIWIKNNLISKGIELIKDHQIFLEETQIKKIKRIESCKCDLYVDDLPEILHSNIFPLSTEGYLFDPNKYYLKEKKINLNYFESWEILTKKLFNS